MRPEHWIYSIPLRLRSLFRRRTVDQELEDELRDHVQRKTEEYVGQGLAPEEARREALLEMGGIEKRKEECRDARRVNWIQDLIQDLRFGLRMLRKSPGFTAVAVVTLALGIGANTAIFSVVNSALLRPLAYREPQQLYVVREIVPQLAKFAPTLGANIPDFRIWQNQVHSFSGVAIAESTSADLTGAGEPEVVPGVRASSNLFDVLGVQPALGRSFLPEEDDAGRGNVVMLTDAFWRMRFQGDPTTLGKTMVLDGVPHEIVGTRRRGHTRARRFASLQPWEALTGPPASLSSAR